ncbi:MAG: hypothetical protein LBJ67_15100 [Planctomycetaceae bacterium]|jgi:hypothetical protein|nr:hypothetical protein [Planctomycetaceae bacterium]
MRLIVIVFMSVLISLLVTGMSYAEISEIRFNEAIKTMKACEKNMGIFKWKFDSQIMAVPSRSPNNVTPSSPQEVTRNSEVLFDWHAKRYKIHQTGQEIGEMPDSSQGNFQKPLSNIRKSLFFIRSLQTTQSFLQIGKSLLPINSSTSLLCPL